ncbi:LPS export ABC transporter periplasmic protein LptC [Microvirga pudoricolor]|uniref:LPS export ABC transporter periplasmic protein LptC n=1 Tax=Microvirga pudoricolor TaxID=2778729 RepID=UPI0019508429|nr:LPS export ABC transporter periplasmic protein LptC [Microvirga pudoricolor]MBM6594045.1 LPS export ABC transporter periplasmic protein LptC [Microvirga pudoricolor]
MTVFQGTMNDTVRPPLPAKRLRAFAQARRHSRWVRFAKWAIPVGSVLAMAAVAFVIVFDPFRNILPGLTVGPITVSGTQVTMEAPKLSGFRNDLRPYQVTATAATQDVRQPNLVELKDLRANLATDDQGGTAHLQARTGVLDTQKEQMKLDQDVHVRTDAGQEVKLRSAFVDFKAGTVVSTEPVTVSLGNGVIEAKGMRVSDNGTVMRFKGRVQTVFRTSQFGPEANPAGQPAAGPASAPAPQAPAQPAQPVSQRP